MAITGYCPLPLEDTLANRLKIRMVRDSNLILETVDFLEAEIEKKMLEIDEAELHYKDEEVELLRQQLTHLVGKLDKEMSNMDTFMHQYSGCVVSGYEREEKEVLSCNSQKKQVSIRGFSSYSGGTPFGTGLSEE